jgi:hypothetical protein
MSITDPGRSTASRVGTDPVPPAPQRRAELLHPFSRETKPSPKTTELWMAILGVGVLTVVYNASRDVSLNLFRACLLGTILVSAYIVSRGVAKAGSRDVRTTDEYEHRA